MSAPDFTSRIHEIERTLMSAIDGAQSGWNDKQSENFRMYYYDPIGRMVNDLEIDIQSHVDNIDRALEKLKSM